MDPHRRERESCTDMWMVFTPSLSLLGKATTSNTSRHGFVSLFLAFSLCSEFLFLFIGLFWLRFVDFLRGREQSRFVFLGFRFCPYRWGTFRRASANVRLRFHQRLKSQEASKESEYEKIASHLFRFFIYSISKILPTKKSNQVAIFSFSQFSRENHATLSHHVPHAFFGGKSTNWWGQARAAAWAFFAFFSFLYLMGFVRQPFLVLFKTLCKPKGILKYSQVL